MSTSLIQKLKGIPKFLTILKKRTLTTATSALGLTGILLREIVNLIRIKNDQKMTPELPIRVNGTYGKVLTHE